MGLNTLYETCVLCRIVADVPDRFVGKVVAVLLWLTRKEPCFGLLPAPVLAECFQESGTERHITVFASFALVNVDDHALAVDVLDSQANQFAPSHAGRIQRHENGARLQIAGGVDQTSDLLRAQHARSPLVLVVRVRYGAVVLSFLDKRVPSRRRNPLV